MVIILPIASSLDDLVDRYLHGDGSVPVPKYHPTARRYLHIDFAKNHDAMGIVMGCRAGTKEIKRTNMDFGTEYMDRAPLIHIDFMLRVKAKVGTQIDYSKVRLFVIFLSSIGYQITVSADSFQSVDTLQILSKRGYDPKVISVDRDDEAYKVLRTATYENRMSYYEYEPYLEEITEVLHFQDRRRVDHPPYGSKDISMVLPQ